jgi:predicted RNA binding protein YcfA (HicA-like mRNA interferase family)
MSARAVRKKLRAAGCEEVRQKGSHVQVKCPPQGRQTTVPVHGSKDIKKGTLRSMERSLQLDIDGDGRPSPNPRRNAMSLSPAQRKKIQAAEKLSRKSYWDDIGDAADEILAHTQDRAELLDFVAGRAAHIIGDDYQRALDILQHSSNPNAALVNGKVVEFKTWFMGKEVEIVPFGSHGSKRVWAPDQLFKLFAIYAYMADLLNMIEEMLRRRKVDVQDPILDAPRDYADLFVLDQNPSKKSKLKLISKDRYRATAAERRRYGGKTVTEFWVEVDGQMVFEDGKSLVVTGYGATPGERKSYAKRVAEEKLGLGSAAKNPRTRKRRKRN